MVVGPFIIKDFLLFQKEGVTWVSPPSRKYEDSDGVEKYFNYVRCKSKEKWGSFQNWAADIVLDKVGSSEPEPTTPDDDNIPF